MTRRSDIADQAAREKASFCLVYRVAPSEYDQLTLREITAWQLEAERLYSQP